MQAEPYVFSMGLARFAFWFFRDDDMLGAFENIKMLTLLHGLNHNHFIITRLFI